MKDHLIKQSTFGDPVISFKKQDTVILIGSSIGRGGYYRDVGRLNGVWLPRVGMWRIT